MGTKLAEGPPKAAETTASPPDVVTQETERADLLDKHRRKLRATALQKGMVRLLTKQNAVNLALVVLLSIVAVIFLLSLFQTGMGNFTISLSRTDLYKYGIELSDSSAFTSASTRLEANSIQGATNISVKDLPPGLDQTDGSHNGQHYIAYTFYVRNNGSTDFNYRYSIDIKETTMALDSAVRLAVYYNGGDREIFAKRATNGQAEPDTVPFATDTVIDTGTILDMAVGSVDKYTVVIWIEGDDPDCTDERLGGVIEMAMSIEVLPEDNPPPG